MLFCLKTIKVKNNHFKCYKKMSMHKFVCSIVWHIFNIKLIFNWYQYILHPLKRDSSPKNENSVIIYSSSSSSKPAWISLFCWTQRKIFWRKFITRLLWWTIDFHSRKKHTMEVNGAPELLCFPHSSEYLPLSSAEQRHSYRFGTTWGWVNDDRIFIFGWTIPLMAIL